jgi:anaerobic selenocysteine-containing dehydrogenase
LAEGLVTLGRLESYVIGLDALRAACGEFAPSAVAPVCGIPASTIEGLARDLAAAPSGVVYGRIGTCTQEFGTLVSWLVDALNVLTGNLDRPGGAMFPLPAAGGANTRGAPRVGREVKLGRRTSRVRSLPETFGELPAVCLAEEIDTPGDSQVRALVTIAGNPVLSLPNGGRLDAALDTLDFMVSVDIYVNETTRHADVILPSPSALTKAHYDVALLQFAVRNVANYSPPVFPLPDGQPAEWEILARLALVVEGRGADADPSVIDDVAIRAMVDGAVADQHSVIHGMEPDKVLGELAPRVGPERMLDFMLRTGPYGDGFGAGPADGLSLDRLLEHPHGIDFGALTPRLPDVLRTPTGMIDLAPAPLVDDVRRLRSALDRRQDTEMVLIGRRELRSNNSWMHNVGVLVKGKPQCTMHIHPDDARRLGLVSGAMATVSSRTGHVEVPVEVTDHIMAGVVSIPHGWGHDLPGVVLAVAGAHAGVNSNVLADEELFDPLSGNAVLNGIPVRVAQTSS